MQSNSEKAKIWFIEDNPMDIELTLFMLESLGMDIDWKIFRNGSAVMNFIKENETSPDPNEMPDLILLDLTLPKLSGIDVLGRIKSNPFYADIHVIILSGSNYIMDIQACLKKGASLFLTKPFEQSYVDKITDSIDEITVGKINDRSTFLCKARNH